MMMYAELIIILLVILCTLLAIGWYITHRRLQDLRNTPIDEWLTALEKYNQHHEADPDDDMPAPHRWILNEIPGDEFNEKTRGL